MAMIPGRNLGCPVLEYFGTLREDQLPNAVQLGVGRGLKNSQHSWSQVLNTVIQRVHLDCNMTLGSENHTMFGFWALLP